MATLAELRAFAKGDEERISNLQTQLDDYWETFDPLFDWTLTEKILRSAGFLRREVVPRREAVLTIAQEIEELNNANLKAQQAEVARRHDAFRDDLHRLLWQSVLLGLAVALGSVFRLRVLERRSDEQRSFAQQAERQMRQLSQQLVAAQEEERKHLSRELHDHVAQVLTALRMELGRIERIRAPGDDRVRAAVAESKKLVDSMFRTVRDLSLGLRPSMLDDLGLQAALEWHVRDFIARYGIDVELEMDGRFDTVARWVSHVCVPGCPGGVDQLRAARQGALDRGDGSAATPGGWTCRSPTTVSGSIRHGGAMAWGCVESRSASRNFRAP